MCFQMGKGVMQTAKLVQLGLSWQLWQQRNKRLAKMFEGADKGAGGKTRILDDGFIFQSQAGLNFYYISL